MTEVEPNEDPGLDTLRAFAIVLVVLRHYREILTGDFFYSWLKPILNAGWVGVELFFVLSGFLIGRQIFRKIRDNGKLDLKNFLIRRSLRILPSTYVVIVMYLLWPQFREHPVMDQAWKYFFFTMNYGRIGEAFSHAWSLCIEEHFYVIFPLVVVIGFWRSTPLRPLMLVISILLMLIAIRTGLLISGAEFYSSVYRPTHTHLDGLVMGVLLALMNVFRPGLWKWWTSRPQVLIFVSFLTFLIHQWLPEYLRYVFSFTLLSITFSLLTLAAMSPGFWLAEYRSKAVKFLSSLAFTLYLTHKSMIHMSKTFVPNYLENPLQTICISIGLMGIAALVCHYGVERPGLWIRDRILRASL